jgi:hypothetical protein
MHNGNNESDHELYPVTLVALPSRSRRLHTSCVVAHHQGNFEILYYKYLLLLPTHDGAT